MRLDDILKGGMFRGKRTYLVGIGMVLSALAQYAAGDLTLAQAAPEVLEGLGFIFMRSAVGRSG